MASKKIITSEINKISENIANDTPSQNETSENKEDKLGSRRKPYNCDICNYVTYKKSNYDKHVLSLKHVKKSSHKLLKIYFYIFT